VQQSEVLGKKEDRGWPVEKPVGGGVSKLTLAEAISAFGKDLTQCRSWEHKKNVLTAKPLIWGSALRMHIDKRG
jgi:hypothetical protein